MNDRSNVSADAAALCADSRWLRALATELCSDAASADDAVQDVWAAALARRPTAGAGLRGWLATALRHRVSDVWRSESARGARERAVSRREALESTADVVERAATHRDVVQALLEIAEPFRTALLLRYFEDVPPREIAKRTGVPVSTVNSRLTRGLAALRAALDRRHGRKSWLLAVLPLTHARPDAVGLAPGAAKAASSASGSAAAPATSFALGALAVNVTLKLLVPAAVVLCAGLWWLGRDSNDAPSVAVDASAPANAPAQLDSGAALALDVQRVEPGARAQLDVARADPPSAPVAASTDVARTVRGRVLDVQGRGLSGVTVGLEGHAHGDVDTSVAGGRFELTLQGGGRSVIATGDAWTTVLAGSVNVLPTSESTVVVAPRIAVAGRVVDERGDAIAGAELVLALPPHFGADFGFALDHSLRREWRARADAHGAFELDEVPFVPDAMLRVSAAGFPAHVEPMPSREERALVVVLARAASTPGVIEGRVEGPDGRPAAGARVSAGSAIAVADERGLFLMNVDAGGEAPKAPAEVRLLAVVRGFVPASHVLPADRAEWPSHVVLRLGGTPPSIAGRVLDEERKPIEDARVWIADATLLGMLDGRAATVESLLMTVAHPFWSYVLTDKDGRFEIPGLLERDYRVRAADPRTLTLAETKPVPSGARDVEIVLPMRDVHEKVSGRVLSRGGLPVAGARVKLGREAFAVEVPGGTHDEWIERPPVTTDAEGRFELQDVPKDGVYFLALSDEILFAGFALTRETPPDGVVITATLRMHVQLEVEPPVERVDTLHVLDETGRRLPIFIMRGESSHTDMYAKVVDGRSEVLSVGETARTMVLLEGDVEVARRDLALLPKTVNRVRY